MLKTLSLSTALAAILATGALAQTTTPQPATPPSVTTPAPSTGSDMTTSTTTTTSTQSVAFKSGMMQDEILVSALNGLEVRNAAGENLGDINDIVVDATGKPSVVVIGVGGFLGMGEKAIGVPFAQLAFADAQDGKRVARLDVTKASLQAAPTYVYKDKTPATTGTRAPTQ